MGCIYLDHDTHQCTIYERRPRACQCYSCKEDKNIWTDFEKMIPAPGLARLFRNAEEDGRKGTCVLRKHPNQESPCEDESLEGIPAEYDESMCEPSDQDTGAAGATTEAGTTVDLSPPDFTELESLIAKIPSELFVPPAEEEKTEGEQGSQNVQP